jgi:hypothetical protein
MSRTVTRLQLKTRARQLSNVEDDPNITDAELNELVNLHMPDVYDILVSAGDQDYYAASYDISVAASTTTYALPADFMRLAHVLVHEGSRKRPVDPMTARDIFDYQAPTGAATVTIEYVPSCPVFTSDADTFDGVDGWDELVSAKMALYVLGKRSGDPSLCMAIIQGTTKRIKSMASERNQGYPRKIIDVEGRAGIPRSTRVDAYRLRAGNIEFYESAYGWP